MKRLVVTLSALLALHAHAGETYLGTLTSTGADVSNLTTASPFFVPTDARITIQCDATAYVLTDTASAVTSSLGVKLSADTLFPTSTGTLVKFPSPDAGAASGGAIVRVISSSGTVNCKVWQRRGSE